MKNKGILYFIFLIGGVVLVSYCQHEAPVQPDMSCIDNQPVEDTTRVYLWPISQDTLRIYPKMIFARFYPWVQDTIQIKQLLEKHHLRVRVGPGILDQQLAAWLCVADDRRAEYHFTPYGKPDFCNFGADSLVEYAFAVFDNGRVTPSGNIVFRFIDGTPQARIDSLFDANGLRFLYTSPDFPTGTRYWTVVTPRAKKNFLDLGHELQKVSFAHYVSPDFFLGQNPLSCD